MIPIIPIPKKADLSGEIRNLPLYITADPQWQGETLRENENAHSSMMLKEEP